jgi:hypothetical protein
MKILSKIYSKGGPPSLGVVHRYMKYNLGNKKNRGEQSRRPALLASPYHPPPAWVLPEISFVVGFYPRRWVLPLRRWVLPFVVGSLPFVVGPYHSSLGPTLRRCVLRPSPLGLPLRRLVLPFAVGFYPLRAAGAITFVWFDTKAAGLNTLVLFNTKAVSCWSVRRRQFDLLAWVSSSSCHRRGPSFVVTGPYSLSSGRRSSFGLRSPLVPLVVAAPHPHGRWVFVSFAGRCWFSGWVAESLSWFITPVVCRMA